MSDVFCLDAYRNFDKIECLLHILAFCLSSFPIGISKTFKLGFSKFNLLSFKSNLAISEDRINNAISIH